MSAIDVDQETVHLECGSSLAEREFVTGEYQQVSTAHTTPNEPNSIEALRSLLAADVVTDDPRLPFTMFTSPFQDPTSVTEKQPLQLPLVYCDQTASNRPCASVERYLATRCLPLYGNTHTNTSITGSQSTAFVAEARQIVAEETNAKITGKASLDVVMFAGQGTTSAVSLLIDCLGLKHGAASGSPVVFVGPYEHHSNLIPWRESGCEIVMVPECPVTKQVDLEKLEQQLQRPAFLNRLKMGTFSAASNVTGKVSDVDAIAATLHRHGALAFFDYATAASSMSIDMNPIPSAAYPNAAHVAKDAVFLSPHKMLGGVGTPGVLIIKKHLVSQTNSPGRSGGGTVFYVTNTHHRFLGNRVERYEGGTPNVAGIIRAGLAFLMKRKAEQKYVMLRESSADRDSIPPTIEDYDCSTHDSVASYLRDRAPNLVLLGDGEKGKKLPIFSFLVRFRNRFLHYNYVCAILNDVFGIQSRGGCQCSGPYSQRLLGLTCMTAEGEVPSTLNEEIEDALLCFKERAELLRPGYSRIALPFKGMRTAEVDYVVKALVWVSKYAWAFMCQYRCNHRTGEWRHANRQGRPLGKEERRWLGHFDFMSMPSGETSLRQVPFSDLSVRTELDKAFVRADVLLRAAVADHRSIAQAMKMSDAGAVLGSGDDKLEKLRWYVYPKECAEVLKTGVVDSSSVTSSNIVGAINPFQPLAESRSLDVGLERGGFPSVTEVHLPSSSDDELVSFQDGEHSGAAPFAEIRTGFHEGELSEHCRVFDKTSEDWVPLRPFFTGGNGTTSASQLVVTESLEMDSNVLSKKATRDKQIWGKGVPVQSLSVSKPGVASTVDQMDAKPAFSGKLREKHDKKKKKKFLHEQPPSKLMRLCTQAIMQWDMIEDGDRLLLGLSGGKDSLSLLHCLLEFSRRMPVKFELQVCTIDPMTPSFDPSPLIGYVESLGLKYHYIRDDIVSRASTAGKDGNVVSSLCAFCARMKRGNLYSCARRNGCNKLVLAQHLDDCAESFMMSVMHNGFLRTMKAHYKINAGDLAVIRPLVYCRESLMTGFAKTASLPVINENCPACFEEPKERARIKKLLSREEVMYPNFYDNIRRSLLPLMHSDATAILRCYAEEAVSKSKKGNRMERRKRPREEEEAVTSAGFDAQRRREASVAYSLNQISDDDLIMELARRKADQFRLSGAMKRVKDGSNEAEKTDDPTGQVCSLPGGPGCIPCYELME